VLAHLATLKIPLSADRLDEILAAATRGKFTYWQLLERLLSEPARGLRERSIEHRLRQARFRDPATLESFDWAFNAQTIDPVPFRELATGDFIRRRDNVAFVGESGLGKPQPSQYTFSY
jgi:DNA replication protein DnaC